MPFGLSGSSSSSKQFLSPDQKPFLLNNFQAGQTQAGQSQQAIQQGLPGFNNQVLNPALQNFAGLASGQTAINPFLEDQINAGVGNLNENFIENILPALRRNSTGNAGFGASSAVRGQLAESNAAGELLDAQAQFESSARGNAFNNQLGAQLQALNLSPQLLDLFTGSANAPFSALLNQAGVLGNPIIEGKSSGSSSGFNFG